MADNEKSLETTEVKDSAAATSAKEDKSASKKDTAPKKNKVSFWKKFGKWLKDFRAEFKKIVWSSRKDTFSSTLLVVVSVVVVALCVSTLDFGFSKLLTLLGGIV